MRIRDIIFVTTIVTLILTGCSAAGHQDFINFRNNIDVGREIRYQTVPHKSPRAGKFIRGDYVVGGEGLTHITTDDNGDLIYHVFGQEILANTRMEKEWIGKCLIYYVVDPITYIVKSWGFDKGGNPLACRSFT